MLLLFVEQVARAVVRSWGLSWALQLGLGAVFGVRGPVLVGVSMVLGIPRASSVIYRFLIDVLSVLLLFLIPPLLFFVCKLYPLCIPIKMYLQTRVQLALAGLAAPQRPVRGVFCRCRETWVALKKQVRPWQGELPGVMLRVRSSSGSILVLFGGLF